MRTTLSIDDDIAAQLERIRKQRGLRLKDLINEALRRGLRDLTSRNKPSGRFQTRSVALGRAYVSIDNVAEALASVETESFG
jgi:hypothetical protein